MHAISSYRGNRHTNTPPHTHTQTHRQDRLQYTAPHFASASITKSEAAAAYKAGGAYCVDQELLTCAVNDGLGQAQ